MPLFTRLLLLSSLMLCLSSCDQPHEPHKGVTENLYKSDSAGFERALTTKHFQFPDDHGAHTNFRDEWWYMTGNLDGPDGKRFGFQITFFRHGLRRGKRPGASHWAGQDAWMAHFALTDVSQQQYHSFQRVSRDAVGLAGTTAYPFRVWLDDWFLEADAHDPNLWRLHARQDGVGIDLEMTSLKPAVLQGDQGLSQKSHDPGNASYYYSMTRWQTKGTVRVANASSPVEGLSWLDREWSTSMLAPNQAGWDWFSLQMTDGKEVMFYRIRRKDGSDDPLSSGSLIEVDGKARHLEHQDVRLSVLTTWRSPLGAQYPASWQLTIEPTGQKLRLDPVFSDQEFRHDAHYWEGAVDVKDAETARILGRGYVEMTGYAP